MTAPMSFDAALAAIDVEETLHPDRMLVTYTILGLDAVRAAHRAEVDALRDAIALVRVNIAHERGCSHLLCIPTCAHAILDAAIRARGAKS